MAIKEKEKWRKNNKKERIVGRFYHIYMWYFLVLAKEKVDFELKTAEKVTGN